MRDVYGSIVRERRSPARRSLAPLLFSILPLFSLGRAVADDFVYPSPNSAVYNDFVVAAGGTLEVEVGTQITGNLHSNGSVDLRTGSTVAGNVSAVGQIVGGGTVTGTKTQGAASVSLPAPFDEATARGLADRIVEGNATYDTDQVIDDVLFVDGDVRFRGSVNGTGTIISSGSIIFDNVTNGQPVVLDPATRLSFSAALDISIGKIHPMRGVLVAGRDLVADKELDITGVVIAGRNARVHQDSKLVKLVLDRFPPAVTITAPADGALVNTPTLHISGTVADDGVITAVLVNSAAVSFSGGQFEADVALAEGENEITAVALDSTGKLGAASIRVTLDATPPVLTLEAPAPGQLTNLPDIRVAGTAADERGLGSVTINGVAAPLVDGRFDASAVLAEGLNTILVRAVDLAGNPRELNVAVTRFTLPSVTITSPADLSYLAATTVDVSGTVTGSVAAVDVNGVSAEVTGTSFIARDVPLIEGGNILSAAATDANGHVGTATINVVRDLTPPLVAIYRPADGSVVREGTVAVSGLVNDIVPGTVNADEAAVTVNGIAAQVANRSFFVVGVPLAPGENTLVARAVDASGNASEGQVKVIFAAASGSRVRVVAGNHQTGEIGTPLAESLVVELVDSAGQPVPGKPVIFKVRENDGSLDGGERQIAVASDAAGRAQATFALGTRAGIANQVVEADAVGFDGPAVFTASALPAAPSLIVVDSGGLQVGVAGQQAPRPLIAAVVDAGHNRLGEVPVVFRVAKGSGYFPNGGQEMTLVTDSDGRAIVTFTLDPEEGRANNLVEARVQGLENGPVASFVASGHTAGDPAETTISGVVLDNTNVPIAGATLRVKHTALTAVTDQQGQFRIVGAPVGAVKLIVDGSTVARPGSWPDLEFDLVTIAGRDTTINMPIYLLPLDLGASVPVDETRGGTLTLPAVPGFALEILPGSVTFPGGSKSGLVSVTVVHNDKVPMVPNFGQQPRLIVTIQPAGARFDPPARLTLPNVDGLPAGKVTEMYSFDHDLGHFVSIGPATVSEDGTVIVSNPGVGIVKAGWHCGGDPATGVCLHNCPECRKCIDPPCRCDPDDTQTPTSITNTAGDCKKPGCKNGSAAQVPDPPDRPVPADARDNFCKNCDSNGNIVPDNTRNNQRVPGTDCSTCQSGKAVDDDYTRNSTGGPTGRACDYCKGKICVDGKCEQKGDPACSSVCPGNMCGTPCSCMGGTGGMGTTEFSCWAVKEPDPANPGSFVFTCYRDYGISGLPDHTNDVCCGGGCSDPVTGTDWSGAGPPYRCTAAERCTLAEAQKCPGQVGF